MSKTLMRLGVAALAVGFVFAAGPPAAANHELKLFLITEGSVQFPFYVKMKRGMDDACALIPAECQFMEIKNIGNVEEERTALEQAMIQDPHGIAIILMDDDVLDEPVQRAIDQGIPVIAVNVDDTKGPDGSARLAYIGERPVQAGYAVTQALSKFFPAEGDIHVLFGIQDYAQSWATQRGAGIERYMEDFKAANPDRNVTWDEIETGIDAGVIASRVGAYVQKNPHTTAYIDVGFFHASAAVGLRDLGYEPGQVLLGGFDIVQMALDEMKTGYIQVTIDQQGYLQGWLSMMELYLLNHGVAAFDVNTGGGLFYQKDVPMLEELLREGR